MSDNQAIRAGRHCVFSIQAYLVFITLNRDCMFDTDAIQHLQAHFSKVCEGVGAKLLSLDGGDNYVMLKIEYPPKLALSSLVNSLKGTSSRTLKNVRPDLLNFYHEGSLWSPSYFAGSSGENVSADIRRYLITTQ